MKSLQTNTQNNDFFFKSPIRILNYYFFEKEEEEKLP